MDIEVEAISPHYEVELDRSSTIGVAFGGLGGTRFGDIIDFDDTNKNDKYVIMYDATSQYYKLVNPDAVLSAASSTETIQPGLPADFENVLDVDLDNRIDLDAGNF
jgi:hypothetical protein